MNLKNKLLVINKFENELNENERLIKKCERNIDYLKINNIDHIGYDKSNLVDFIFDRPELNEKICFVLIEHYENKKESLIKENEVIIQKLKSMIK